jgi:hypothetical protein
MIRASAVSLAVFAAIGLAACGEKPQTAAMKKSDTQAWQASQSEFIAPGWKEGDRASWEEQLRSRAQSQNDYAKAK